ncbi:MAG TPA: EamA family transporter RarD [Mycobacteriales bacterium]|nr:EamA family transporter RarD [Mycobacteriales bacterium]
MSSERRGIVLGVAAYVMWGLFPIYWPWLEPGGALEVLAHRVVWSLVFVLALVLVVRRRARGIPYDARSLRLLCAAAVLIGINWGVFIWAVNHGRVLDGSLGYFINPLVTVALGVFVLGERLRTLQWSAVAIAAVGVTILAVETGHPPWVALVLALTFGTYGLVKRVVGVGALQGLAVEAAVLAPVALGYLIWLGASGGSTFTGHGASHVLLLMSSGPVTAVPLLLFAGAAARMPLSQLGVLFYLNPTMQFLIGVFVKHEPLTAGRLAGFALVWVALIAFTADSLTHHRRSQMALTAEASAA